MMRFLRIVIITLIFLWISTPLHSTVLFQWNVDDANSTYGASDETELATNGSNSKFVEVNKWKYGDGARARYDNNDITANSGSWSIKLVYPVNEAGFELWPIKGGWSTGTIYIRWYEYFTDEWQYDFPKGLKISRWFTDGTAYLSPKLWTRSADCGALDEWRRANFSIKQCDILFYTDELYSAVQYIQTGRWYKFELWMDLGTAVVGSADTKNAYCTGNSGSGNYGCDNGVGQNASADGTLQVWIDGDLTLDISGDLAWRRTNDGVSTGTVWEDGWFGGNYTASSCGGEPGETVYRYLDDFYVSTTLDRDEPPPAEAPVVSIVATDASATEEGQGTGTFRVSRTGSTSGALVVNYTLGGTASEASDVDEDLSGGSLTILDGNAYVDQTITPTDDAAVEGSETLTMTIAANSYDIGSPDQASVTIEDNELVEGEVATIVFGAGGTGEINRGAGTGSILRQ